MQSVADVVSGPVERAADGLDHPPMPTLLPGEVLLCLWPGCNDPIDPVAWPTHPSHELSPEEWAAWHAEVEVDRQAEMARDDARREVELRALTRSTRRTRSKRGRR